MEKKSDFYFSKIDSERFNFLVSKVNLMESDVDIDELIEKCIDKNIKLMILRLDYANIKLINYLEKQGFRLKDTQISYIINLKKLTQINPSINHLNKNIRPVKKSDIGQIQKIAGEAFNKYGHYFANEDLENEKCRLIYEDWAKRCCLDNNVADVVFVAGSETAIDGFIALKKSIGKDADSYCVIGALNTQSKGQGIYTALVKQGINWGIDENLSSQKHDILLNNFPVNKVLSNAGFRATRAFVTMHKWLY